MHPMKHFIDSIPQFFVSFNKACDIYTLAKQTKLPFGLSYIFTMNPLNYSIVIFDVLSKFLLN